MLRSTSSTVKKVSLRCFQSLTKMDAPFAFLISLRELADGFRIAGHHLDDVDAVLHVEECLSRVQRHEADGLVVLRHAELEDGDNFEVAELRFPAENRRLPARIDEGDLVAGRHAQRIGEPQAERDPFALIEAVERADPQVAGDEFHLVDVLGPHAAHDGAKRVARRSNEHLALDQRHRRDDAGKRLDLIAHRHRNR